MKPQPLDQGNLRTKIIDRLKNNKQFKYLYNEFEEFLECSKNELSKGFVLHPNENQKVVIDILALFELTIEETIKEIKQRIEKACYFYWLYKDKPALLWKEREEYRRNLMKLDKLEDDYYRFDVDNYNEWLFKLAFKDVMKCQL